jgi:hypothetical protein
VGGDAIGAGIGLGSLLFIVAQTLPEPYKLWLSAASPTISAVCTAAWVFLRLRVARRWSEWEVRRAINRAKRTVRRGINRKNISEERRAKLRKDLEELEDMEVRSDINVAKALIKKRQNLHK